MNAGPGFARIRSPSAPQEVISAVLPQPSIPNTMRRLEGRAVTCVPEQLRLHQALDELGWTSADELNDDARLKDQLVPEPILITMGGTILAGFGRWRLALFERRREIHCIAKIGLLEIELPFATGILMRCVGGEDRTACEKEYDQGNKQDWDLPAHEISFQVLEVGKVGRSLTAGDRKSTRLNSSH